MKVSKYKDRSGEERTGFEILADEVALWQSLPAGHSASSEAGSAESGGSAAVAQGSPRVKRRPAVAPGSRGQPAGRAAPEPLPEEDDLPF
jgi:single-stranded DNA-binding protein